MTTPTMTCPPMLDRLGELPEVEVRELIARVANAFNGPMREAIEMAVADHGIDNRDVHGSGSVAAMHRIDVRSWLNDAGHALDQLVDAFDVLYPHPPVAVDADAF